ncbi:homing endonuclease [Salmonella phage vB_SenM_UTK0003]|nr:homing endonuclease [Salmonella phage vB_SenM_UTK0003]
MENCKYHYVYEITNNINGKKYIGKHSTNNLDDGYVGSGVFIKKAINKYGLENFTKIIIKKFDTSKEAFEFEAEMVTEDVVKNRMYYNAKPGGYGGIYMTEEIKKKMKESSRKRYLNSPGTTLGTTCYTNGKKNRFLKPGDKIPDGFYIGQVIPNKKCRKGCAVKPTTTGTFWVNNGTINKLMQPSSEIPVGFVKGRLMKRGINGEFIKG